MSTKNIRKVLQGAAEHPNAGEEVSLALAALAALELVAKEYAYNRGCDVESVHDMLVTIARDAP